MCVCVCECVCARVRDIIVLATLPTIDQQLYHAITDLTHKKLYGHSKDNHDSANIL